MSLRFFERIARLARADAHGVVAALEDRTLLLEQHVREAELALKTIRTRHAQLAEAEERLRRAAEAEERVAARFDEDATLALAGGKDELARFALRRWLASRRRREAFAAELAAVGAERTALAERLARNEAELVALHERVRAHRARRAAAAEAASVSVPSACGVAVADEEVDLEFLRRRGDGAVGSTDERRMS